MSPKRAGSAMQDADGMIVMLVALSTTCVIADAVLAPKFAVAL